MFTGIVRERGRVTAIDGGAEGVRLRIDAPATAAGIAIGDSVAVGGVCLTAVGVDGTELSFDAVPETLSRTALGRLRPGAEVNVEPALRAGEPLGGHVMQGHVDGVGRVRSVEPEGDGSRIWIDAPTDVLRYCVDQGLGRRRRHVPHRGGARRRRLRRRADSAHALRNDARRAASSATRSTSRRTCSPST